MKSLIFSLLLIHANATNFLIVRHGETDWNKEKIWQGTIDLSLNETGRSQAMMLRDQLQNRHFDLCFTSHLIRTIETANILTNIPNQIDRRLEERSKKLFFGSPKIYEDSSLVSNRVFECLEEIAKKHPDKEFLIVTHGGVIKQIISDILKISPKKGDIEVPNMSTLEITYLDGHWAIVNSSNITYFFSAE